MLIRVQDLKLNLCWASSFSFSSSALTSIVDFSIFNKTLAESSRHVDLLKMRLICLRLILQETSDSRIEKWHTLCVPGPCHHLRVCHSIHAAFSLLIYTIAEPEQAWGPPFHPEPTVHCYSWTLKGEVTPRKRGLRSTEFKEGKCVWSRCVCEISPPASRFTSGRQIWAVCVRVCAMFWVAAASTINTIITITSCLMYNSVSSLFKV